MSALAMKVSKAYLGAQVAKQHVLGIPRQWNGG